jgi:HEAT repeat protein
MVALAALAVVTTGAHAAVSLSTAAASSLPGLTRPAAPAPTAPAAASGPAAFGRQALNFLAGRAADPDPDVRIAVAADWGDIGNAAPKVLELLMKAGKDRDDFVRIEAGYSLFRLGDEGGRRILMDLVRSSATAKGALTPAQEMKLFSHTKARAQALVKLSDMANEDVVALMEQTLTDGSAAIRDATAVALCRLDLAQEPPVAPYLKAFLDAAKDKDDTVRVAAVKALGQTNLASVRETLVAAAGDPSAAVRAEAMAALAASADETLAQLFIDHLKDENLRVRYQAVGGLARIAQEPSALATLRKLAADDKAPDLALRAMTGLAAQGEKVDLDLAQRQLRANDVDGRMLALEVVAGAPGDAAPGLLAQVMAADASMRVRVAAAAMLVKRLQRKGT